MKKGHRGDNAENRRKGERITVIGENEIYLEPAAQAFISRQDPRLRVAFQSCRGRTGWVIGFEAPFKSAKVGLHYLGSSH